MEDQVEAVDRSAPEEETDLQSRKHPRSDTMMPGSSKRPNQGSSEQPHTTATTVPAIPGTKPALLNQDTPTRVPAVTMIVPVGVHGGKEAPVVSPTQVPVPDASTEAALPNHPGRPDQVPAVTMTEPTGTVVGKKVPLVPEAIPEEPSLPQSDEANMRRVLERFRERESYWRSRKQVTAD